MSKALIDAPEPVHLIALILRALLVHQKASSIVTRVSVEVSSCSVLWMSLILSSWSGPYF
eukprot:1160995-Pelagomonas_calceolata.AAC.9